MFRTAVAALIFCLALLPTPILDAAPNWQSQMNYQGQLTDNAGNAVTDGSYSVTFRIYDDPTGGALIWSESQSVTTVKGLFNVKLGSVTPLSLIANTNSLYLTLQVSGDSEMLPRQPLNSTPFAFNSAYAESAASASSASFATNAGSATNATNATNLYNPAIGNQPVGGSAYNIVALNAAAKIPASFIAGSAVTAPLDLTTPASPSSSYVLRVHNAGTGIGITASANSTTEPAVWMEGLSRGAMVRVNASDGIGVEVRGAGTARASLMNLSRNALVYGYAPGTANIPVLGESTATSGIGVIGMGGSSGVGVSGNAGTYGVFGAANTYGVYGYTPASGYGVFGISNGSGIGVYGSSVSNIGGYFSGAIGLYASGSSSGWGVQGTIGSNATGFLATGSTGVSGTGSTVGVFARGITGTVSTGTYNGLSASGAIYGAYVSASVTGNITTYGLRSQIFSNYGYGVYSVNSSSLGGYGGYFEGFWGGLEAYGRSGNGINAYSDNNSGVSASGWGTNGYGLYAEGRTGVYAYAEGGTAMRAYQGDVGWGLVAEGYYEGIYAPIFAYTSSGNYGIVVSSTAGTGIKVDAYSYGLDVTSTNSYGAYIYAPNGTMIAGNSGSYALDLSSQYGIYNYANSQGIYSYTYGTNAYNISVYSAGAGSWGVYSQASAANSRGVYSYVGTCISCHAGYFENLTYGASAGQFSGSALFVNGRATLTSMANTFTLTTTLGTTLPATVTNRYMNSSDVVVLTPRGDVGSGGRYWISSQSNGQFIVSGSGLPNGSISFNYLIIGR